MLGRLSRSTLAAITAIAFSAGAPPVLAQQPAMTSAGPRQVKAGKRGLFGSVRTSLSLHGRKSAGISVAQGKRNASKARNVARNRAQHR